MVITDIQDELGSNLAAEIRLEKAIYRHCDVKDEKQVEEIVAFALEKFGTLNIMFCNAEILGLRDNVLDMNSTDFDETLAVNILGSALAIKHSARAMVERKIRGSIISTASIEATLVCAAPIEYVASKAAVIGLLKAVDVDLG